MENPFLFYQYQALEPTLSTKIKSLEFKICNKKTINNNRTKIRNQKYNDTKSIEGLGVEVSSVFRFKGLENEIVIFLIPNFASLEASYTRNPLNLVYVGISRAKFLLYLIGNKEVKNKINWDKN